MKTLVKNVLLLIIVSLLCFTILEIASRHLVYQSTTPKGIFLEDDELNSALIPNSSTSYRNYDYEKIDFSTNSDGLRDKEYGEKEKFRIVALGDSMILSLGTQQHLTIPKQLETILNQKGKEVEVVNMAVSGYGTVHERIMLERLKHYNPDMVLYFFTANDVINNVETTPHIIVDGWRILESNKDKPKWLLRTQLLVWGNLNTLRLLRQALIAKSLPTNYTVNESMRQATINEINLLEELTNELNAPLLIFTHPEPKEFSGEVDFIFEVNQTVVDLSPSFDTLITDELLWNTYYFPDGHYRNAGNAVAAHTVAYKIQPLIP